MATIEMTINADSPADLREILNGLADKTNAYPGFKDNPADPHANTESTAVTPVQPAPTAPVQPVTPTQPVAVPTTAAPVAPQAPVAPTSAAPVQPAPTQAPTAAAPVGVPTNAPAYTFDQLAAAAAPLMDAGKGPQLIETLHAFGVDALTSLPPESYGAFAAKMRELGAKI